MADFQPQKESKSTSLGTTPCLPVQVSGLAGTLRGRLIAKL